jgi:hypothetical protein
VLVKVIEQRRLLNQRLWKMFLSPLTQVNAKSRTEEGWGFKEPTSRFGRADPKSTVIEVSDGKLPHLSPLRALKFCDSQNSLK